APVLADLRGLEPSALIPRSSPASAATSRTAPLITTPAQPFSAAAAAIMSPISAVRSEPPPSTTSTQPSPGWLSCSFTRALSRWHLIVAIGPWNADRPPNERNCSSQLCSASPCSSIRSAVAKTSVIGLPRMRVRWWRGPPRDRARCPRNAIRAGPERRGRPARFRGGAGRQRGPGRRRCHTGPVATHQTSVELFERAGAVVPGAVNSPVRAFGAVGGTPPFMASGNGPYLTDVDGNTYVDLICSWGPLLLGHTHPAVVDALQEAAAHGTSFGAPSPGEVELAEEITARTPVQKVRLVNSGTEATMSA